MITEIKKLNKIIPCCGFILKNNKLYHFENFDIVHENDIKNIIYFLCNKSKNKYTFNMKLYNIFNEKIEKALIHKISEYNLIDIYIYKKEDI